MIGNLLLSIKIFIAEINSFKLIRIIDVGSEWRTFANDKESTDMTRVGAAEVSLTSNSININLLKGLKYFIIN